MSRVLSLAGFQVTLIGRFWVTPEDMDPNKPNMAKGYFVDRAIDDATFIMERIDARWPVIVNSLVAKEP
jgi:hypothetical protein